MAIDYAWLKCHRLRGCVDRQGSPIPWFTYPAIDYLNQLDLFDMDVFEWGSGYSTAYWSRRARSVISVETDPAWAERVKSMVGPNSELLMSSEGVDEYVANIEVRACFDVIVIDGTGESRKDCALAASNKLKPGGFIILDDADLWPGSAASLRENGYIEIDFTGFAPGSPHCHTTSFFLTRDFDARSRRGLRPIKSVAQPSDPWPGQ